jgi:CRP-like cAMP-binding protein
MLQSPVFQAFALGIISALSLFLGALTAGFWKPRDRVLAFLLAFGAGALFAAIAFDLVAPSISKGHFGALTFGAVLGGLAFVVLNQILNHYGGFLRKASTTFYYLRKQRQRKVERILSQMGRIDLFRSLPPHEAQKSAAAVVSKEYKAGTTLYRQNDPCVGLYIIEKGEVELLDPKAGMQPFQRLQQNDAFGRMAFFTGAPHATVAVATADTHVWVLPRQDFINLLKESPNLAEALQIFLSSQEVGTYLAERQGLTADEATRWERETVRSLQTGGGLLSAVEIDPRRDQLKQILSQVQRLPIFGKLPPNEVEELTSRFFYKQHEKGHTFFHQGESPDRMYIIDYGEIALVDPDSKMRTLMTLRSHAAFGAMAFLTGAPHTVTAIADVETGVWVLRKEDFSDLLLRSPALEDSVKDFLQQEEVFTYLQTKQTLDSENAQRWVQKAVHNLEDDKLIPSATELAAAAKEHHGASLAIWMGSLLDNIPESFVIGSSLIHSGGISLSLLVGLFLANFPEALSSSVGMRQQGMRFSRILWMWASLVLITGVGAAFGNVFFAKAPEQTFSVIEGVAAGAMLTMVAETMLPEAYIKGSSVIGASTLLGFLSAILCKALESNPGH